MTNDHEVIVIAADERQEQPEWSERQIRVAAYCRVSTDMEEQLTSFEAQKDYYTAKIMENRQWIMAGIFADGTDIIGLNQKTFCFEGFTD